jgi:SAM-dependent methyltransferase
MGMNEFGGVPEVRDASGQRSVPAAPPAAENHAGLDDIVPFLHCPIDGAPLTLDAVADALSDGAGHRYRIERGIPCLFVPNDWDAARSDVTDTVKAFYEKTPFPNYDGLDTRDSLRAKARDSVFARLLDEQLPRGAAILEVGCGTGQMSNFLGMGWGRTVIGADICMNSLGLANGFRNRFSINNAHFVQMNLFRPAFREGTFDVVWSNGVLHHTSDCAGAFRSIARLVKPGGFIIVGLYNWLGRYPTLWRRWLIEHFGLVGALLDPRMRGKGEAARREAWFMDQYKHPHETKHSMCEVLGWFDATGFEFTSSVPTIGDVEFSDDLRLFEPQSPRRTIDRISTEVEMLLSGGTDGGLYIMIGRKKV